jgi:toxin-antitoxin system PIN domain toxin
VAHTIDVNVLLYASDQASPMHDRAVELIDEIALGPEIVYLFWPTVMAYLRISTHPAVFDEPLAPSDAVSNIEQLLALPHVRSVGEGETFWHRYREVAGDVNPRGNLVPDAHIVALMLENGVRTIWSRDRDLRKFRGVTVKDPFAA